MGRREKDEQARDGDPEAGEPARSDAAAAPGDLEPETAGGKDAGGEDARREAADSVAGLTDKWLRAKAELENVRRAARLESEQARRYGAGPVILALLSVLDNLQRALAAPPESVDGDYLEGLRLIERQFLDALAGHGVAPVPAEKGAPLDPSVHRALMEQDSDEVAPGCILIVAVPGYTLHDRLLREAQVVVARAPAPAET